MLRKEDNIYDRSGIVRNKPGYFELDPDGNPLTAFGDAFFRAHLKLIKECIQKYDYVTPDGIYVWKIQNPERFSKHYRGFYVAVAKRDTDLYGIGPENWCIEHVRKKLKRIYGEEAIE